MSKAQKTSSSRTKDAARKARTRSELGSVSIANVRKTLKAAADADIASHSLAFFKCGPGEYGEGDQFLGIRVPMLRKFSKQFCDLSTEQAFHILRSKWHEQRLFALIVLSQSFARGNAEKRQEIYDGYLQNVTFINNWDLVDSSAHKIVGPYLQNRSRKVLYRLAKSSDIWERRIAMMSTYHFIRQNDFKDAIAIATILLGDKEELIHKVSGWMLREIGKRDIDVLRSFLKEHQRSMPRTMLRYSIEKLEKAEQLRFMKGSG